MNLTLNTTSAKAADNIASAIKEAGKYIGTITRAEALKSQQGTLGLGLSFKTAAGQSADYLDIYTHKANGEELMGCKTVNALLACLGLREAKEGHITFEKWNNTERKRETVTASGYPDLMGKSIGLLLQKELGTHSQTGADTEKMVVFGVFSPTTELTASEILDRQTNPKRLAAMTEALMARPVRDNRSSIGARPIAASGKPATAAAVHAFSDMDDDIPFIVNALTTDIKPGKVRRLARADY